MLILKTLQQIFLGDFANQGLREFDNFVNNT